ncbi:MAG: hypothetical protein DRI89_10120 [Bacteroidetes bacterium]|nr:MAG: hypothetical protein DRI89_10120 [Bacteroidota bacterium]
MLMEEQEQTNKPFFSGVAMQVILKYKKHLTIIGIVAVLLSAIFSGPTFITPLYKSNVILYPTASNSISKVLLSENMGNSKDILEFGEEEQTEQMLQVLNSNKIRDRVVIKYNLLDHYEIKPGSKYRMTRLIKEYETNFRFRRTEYMAVSITVFDRDAQMAADMANDVAELVDSTINRMQKKVAIKAFEIVEREYFKLKDEIQVKEDSLTVLRGYGVHDYESQSEMFNRQLAIEMAKGNAPGIKRLEDKLEILSMYGGPYVSIRDALLHDKKQLSQLKAKYEEAKVDATENLPHKFVVSNAIRAEKKSYPIRWLIVLITTFSVLFLATLIFGMMEILSGRMEFDIKKKDRKLGVFKRKNDVQADSRSSNSPVEVVEKVIIRERIVIQEPVKVVRKEQEISGQKEVEKEITKRDNNNFKMDNFFNSANLVKLIVKWRYHLLIVVGVAALLAAIFSGPTFITPMYKSYAVSYPANVEPYSEESTTEQMLQILNAQDIVDSVIQKYDLARHYEIDPDYEYYKTVLLYEYHQNVSVSKTPFESVLIEVHDKDPVMARDMVNAILDFYNKKISRLHKNKYVEVVDMYESQLLQKRQVLDSLKQILYVLGTEYGLIDYSATSQEIMRGYLKTVYGGNAKDINTKEVKRLLDNMEIKSGQLIEVVQMLQNESRAYVDIKLDLEMNVRFLNANMTYSNIVTYPFVSDKKSYPVRWIIVVIVSLAAFIFALLVILFLENRKKLQRK